MTRAARTLTVEVIYVGAEGVATQRVEVPEEASVADAIAASGIVSRLGLVEAALGLAIHGQRAFAATPLRDGDRVELLRPLLADPKEARKARAKDHPLLRPKPRRKSRAV